MKIVIDIPKHIYEHAKEQSEDDNDEWDAMRAIANGTPLPKGHGRLIDISEYEKYFNTAITYDDGNHTHVVYTNIIPTIIEESESE